VNGAARGREEGAQGAQKSVRRRRSVGGRAEAYEGAQKRVKGGVCEGGAEAREGGGVCWKNDHSHHKPIFTNI
jgi:hypothetical protein